MVRRLRGELPRLFDEGTGAALSDGELLGRFLDQRGDAGSAFGALVARHGPMVARVCRAVLGREADAEDAFQATFLVLVRRAGAIGERELLGPWLYRVALRVARRARSDAAKRAGREGGQVADGFDPPDRATTARPGPWADDAPTLLEEVDRLPSRYRLPVVLCHLQGLTHAEAAGELAWPVGTVSVRLVRARRLLADRLARRGVGGVSVGVALPPVVTIPVAPGWLARATAAALEIAHRLPVSPATAIVGPAASRGALNLARSTAPMIWLAPWKWFALPAGLLVAGAGASLTGIGTSPPADDQTDPPSAPAPTPPAPARTVLKAINRPVQPKTPEAAAIPPILFRGRVHARGVDQKGVHDVLEADTLSLHVRPTIPDAPPIPQRDPVLEIEASGLDAHGTLADLARLARDLARTDPTAQVHLQVEGRPGEPVLYRIDGPTEGDRPAASQIYAPTLEITCPADRLGAMVHRLQPTSSKATFRLQIDGGTVRYRGDAAPRTTTTRASSLPIPIQRTAPVPTREAAPRPSSHTAPG